MICTNEEVIQRIKDCGQELIENAENIVGYLKYGTALISKQNLSLKGLFGDYSNWRHKYEMS